MTGNLLKRLIMTLSLRDHLSFINRIELAILMNHLTINSKYECFIQVNTELIRGGNVGTGFLALTKGEEKVYSPQ